MVEEATKCDGLNLDKLQSHSEPGQLYPLFVFWLCKTRLTCLVLSVNVEGKPLFELGPSSSRTEHETSVKLSQLLLEFEHRISRSILEKPGTFLDLRTVPSPHCPVEPDWETSPVPSSLDRAGSENGFPAESCSALGFTRSHMTSLYPPLFLLYCLSSPIGLLILQKKHAYIVKMGGSSKRGYP